MVVSYSVSQNSDGNYYLGPSKNYILSGNALKHIIFGDLSERVVRNDNNKFIRIEQILKGGLHTAEGWINLKNKLKDVVHGHMFNPDVHKHWYFARELQNGVILLKIPSHIFQSNAAKLTKFADMYYKSGYLWKTLFPEYISSEEAIISSINEALHKIDKEESTDSIIIGYAYTDHPFKAIKLRIQLIENVIISAFPTWGQPKTGNNGKPYSHLDTINFRIAESTKYFDDYKNTYIYSNQILPRPFGFNELIRFTPKWILNRKTWGPNQQRIKWAADRNSELVSVAGTLDRRKITSLITYLKEPIIAKDPIIVMTHVYNSDMVTIKSNTIYKNAISLYQNLREGLFVLSEYDKLHNTSHSIDYAIYFMKQKFIHTGGIDLWETMRLYRLIIKIVKDHSSTDSISRLLNTLSESSCRMGAYTDFNLNPYLKHDLSVIGVSHPEILLLDQHLYDFIAQNLGENYSLAFNQTQRNQLAKGIVTRTGSYTKYIVKDCVEFALGDEFTSFGWDFSEMVDSLVTGKVNFPTVDALEKIFYDFHRVKVLERSRVIIENIDILKDKPDYSEFGTAKFNLYTEINHIKQFIDMSYDHFVKAMLTLLNIMGATDVAEKITTKSSRYTKEIIPLPKGIPSYIDSWQKEGKGMQLSNEQMIPAKDYFDILGVESSEDDENDDL